MRNFVILGPCVFAVAVLLSGTASAKTYNYTLTAAAPPGPPHYNSARDYGYVPVAPGTLLAKGTLTTSNVVNDLSSTFLCPNIGCPIYGNTITAMTGTFLNEAINFLPSPHAPEFYGAGNYYGDYQLLKDQPLLLDEGGVVFSTASLGYANLWGNRGTDDYPPYSIYDSNKVVAPTRSGFAPEHYYADFALTLAEELSLPGGTQNAPLNLPSAAISNITGAIGPENLERFYSFQWGGGLFTSLATVSDAQPTDNFRFYVSGKKVSQTVKIDAASNFSGGLNLNLPKGRYTIGLLGTLDIDPIFSIAFGTPVAGAVPEPASWMTMLAGFGAIGAMLRRRRRNGVAATA